MRRFEPKFYIKDNSFDPIYKEINKSFLAKSRIYPLALVSLGIIILTTQVIIPLVFFETADAIPKPIVGSVLGKVAGFGEFSYQELSRKDATDVSTMEYNNIPKYFYLTIPKLKIKNAMVETNPQSLNPDKALGHYPGSALPGQPGNTFIYGHSVLSWFYNPKNYKTIFSTLDNLETGDVFYMDYKDKTYTYKVESKEVENSDNINPLAEIKPKFLNYSTVVLMTCYPMGTKSKRLLVKAVGIED